MSSINPELIASFLEEAEEYLADIRAVIDGGDEAALRAALDAGLLNLKGVAGMVGQQDVLNGVECLQSLLGRARPGELATRIGPGLDALARELRAIRGGDEQALKAAAETLAALCAEEDEPRRPDEQMQDAFVDLGVELKDIFLEEAQENTRGMSEAIFRLIDDPLNMAEGSRLFRHMMNLKSSAAMMRHGELVTALDLMIRAQEAVERGRLTPDEDTVLFFTRGMREIKSAIDLIGEEREIGPAIAAFDELAETHLPEYLFRHEDEPEQDEASVEDEDDAALGIFNETSFLAELQKTFRSEGEEYLKEMAQLILEAERHGDNPELVHRLFRALHTLKGAAATAGFKELSASAHKLENLLDRWREDGRAFDDAMIGLLYEAERRLRHMLELPADDDGSAVQGRLLDEALARHQSGDLSDADEMAASPARPAADDEPESTAAPTRSVRVSIDRLDGLMNTVSEMNAYRLRLDETIGVFNTLSKKLKWERRNISKAISEFQRRHQWEMPPTGLHAPQLGEFSELELDNYGELAVFARNLEDMDFKVHNIVKQLEHLLSQFSEDSGAFNNLIATVRDDMIQMRMVPLEHLFRRLTFMTGNLSRALKKKVKVVTYGGNTEIDKSIVDDLAEPMLHIIRNSLDHGIESPEVRERLGKPVEGILRLSASQDERNVVIIVEDDGAGIDVGRIAERAILRGVITREEADKRSRNELLNLIFFPQVSTSESVGMVSGRGVGMDVVRHTISEMYGSIHVESRPNSGTRLTLRLPFTLAVQPLLTVTAEAYAFNLPMHYVERILEADEVQPIAGETGLCSIDGQHVPLRWLSGFFRVSHDNETAGHPAIVLRNAERRMALLVDAVTGREEGVVRPLNPLIEPCVHFLGSTISASGAVRLVLNVPVMFEMNDNLPALAAPRFEPEERVRVLIADDSLSVRQTIKFLLGKHGIHANTAKDGLLAWQKLHGIRPDLLIVDLEMPNLNGFELMERIRQDPAFAHLPMLVLTSRGGAKHHQRAMQCGADGFLSKPALERELIARIRASLPSDLRELMDERDPNLMD